ncbi:hypothetical protein L3Y34_016848 [Caenorhabditis briggsae]|uniref:Uncharacterized protein n=1 Tax=Caenorhabditis briggsae TaxID=6238 RepID=A0AAE9DGQ0_CAEBR|nr:hypothetical protein L3Y34_016848 [Caenorhabditis briggsae]
MKPVLLSLVVVLTTNIYCQDSSTDASSTTPLDCGYLANSYKNDDYSYDGQCCNPKAVAYMDEEYGSNWREDLADAVSRTTFLFNQRLCDVSSTSSTTAATSSTTELKSSTTNSPTTTTEEINCSWYNRMRGICGASTASTTSPAKSEFKSTDLTSTTEAEMTSESGECMFSVMNDSSGCVCVIQIVKSSLGLEL